LRERESDMIDWLCCRKKDRN